MPSDAEVVRRLLVALLLSGLIGFEREITGRAAGFRTHILVCVGSALVMLTALHLVDQFRGVTMLDPGRFAAQVVTGVGFLGAGTIIHIRDTVRGLTTAASLWVAAGIGLAVGSGFYIGAIGTTAIVLMVLLVLSQIEKSVVGTKRKSERG